MVELKGKKKKQTSSKPEGWLPAGVTVQLELTCRQEKYARRCVGITRAVYNVMVATHELARAHGHGLWPSPMEMEKLFNEMKKGDHESKDEGPLGMAFVTQVSKFVAQGACRDFRNAYSRWLNPDIKARKPVFHKKKRTGTGSFLAASGITVIRYDGHRRIRLPYLGSVRMTRKLPEGIPYEVTIRKRNGRWYASIAYWKPPVSPPRQETQSAGGADVGITPLTVDSDGVSYENPKGYYRCQRDLRRWQRAQARRTPGSTGWWEAQRRLDRLHRRAAGLRNNAHHQISRILVLKYHTLGIESLNVAGMIRAGLQSKALSDAAMSSLLGKIRYKAQWYGTKVVEAGQTYPSSKTCSACGEVNPGLKRQPRWTCPNCGQKHDRNRNAACNLRHVALLAVGEKVMLLEGAALAGGDSTACETAPGEGRTKPVALAHS